ncbi:hypothetical protein LTR62_002855 [Meristemomyces frigidus]|uniref:Uncharacterized protein n=1 Tax=Meristemomyces frigidus TaxID=1508187 RepID=A0AAN7YSL1_9PEZI|nr:hypothetical protein LTR62_002855 [Meristemomyces frigidus]
MAGLLMLILLCAVMAAASFAAGVLPLSFSLSQRQLRLITALGTGVLVGTSLIIIIPEGVETLYSAARTGAGGHEHKLRELEIGMNVGRRDVDTLGLLRPIWRDPAKTADRRDDVLDALGVEGNPGEWDATTQTKDDSPATPPTADTPSQNPDHGREPHTWIGISLVAGFALMYLIDTLPKQIASASKSPRRFSISLTSLSFNRIDNDAVADTPTQEAFGPSSNPNSANSNSSGSNSTTIGLLIHALADGIALGASSASASSGNTSSKKGSRLTFIIFLALMLHKAPAAFGLTAVLLKQGLSKRLARAHLIVFSLAAPIGALGTWFIARVFASSSSAEGIVDSGGEGEDTIFATGVLLLFSGGTFLYVAVHTMMAQGSGGHEHQVAQSNGNGYLGVAPEDEDVYGMSNGFGPGKAQQDSDEGGGVVDTLVTGGGMLVPLLLGAFGHGH